MVHSALAKGLDRLVRSSRTHLWPGEQLSDGELLTLFAERGEARAFEALVRRHGPMVRSVARRTLGEEHAAEDVLQATFLVLARNASSVRNREAVGCWLHGVAHRLARRARRDSLRRRALEPPTRPGPPDPLAEISARELQGILDEELGRLSEPLRAPLVLCYLEGLTRDQAARRLGWSARTVKRRLREGKEALRRRLERRGFPLSAALLPGALHPPAPCPAEAVTRAALGSAGNAPSPMAIALAEAALPTLFSAKGKVLTGVAVLVLLLGIGTAALLRPTSSPRAVAAAPAAKAPLPGDRAGSKEKVPPRPLLPPVAGEDALAAGLKWLARQQGRDGRWDIGRVGAEGPVAGTALGLLPFLRAGQTHQGKGPLHPYAPVVRRGLDALVGLQQADGGFKGTMYGQALATWALAEAYLRTHDARLRGPAQKAADYIVRAQHEQGGWRYVPGQPGDTSVTTWQVLALGTARRAGLKVPERVSEKARKYLDTARVADGGFSYLPGIGKGSPSMTAAGLYGVLELGAKPDDDRVQKALALLAKSPPTKKTKDIYYYHFATRAHERAGGAAWKGWKAAMRRWLLAAHDPDTGSWDPAGHRFINSLDGVVMTSLCLLTLEPCVETPADPRLVRPPRTAKEAAAMVQALGETNFLEARRLVEALAGGGGVARAVIEKELRSAPRVDAKKVARLIADLDDDSFAVRQKAEAELIRLGEGAEAALQKELARRPSLEAHQRIERILRAISPDHSPERRRRMLAREALGRMGSEKK
jgi:RNA polymerase sigma factor (sigma-70 family)